MKKRRKVMIAAAALVVLTAGGLLAGRWNRQRRAHLAAAEVAQVKTVSVKRQNLINSISVTGTIKSADARDVSASAREVKVLEVNCKVGDYVQAGDVMVVLDASDLELKLQEAQNRQALSAYNENKSIETASENYAEAVGKAPMMPEYGLGFWQCKLRYYNQEQVIRIAEEYKKREIPLDVLVIDYFHWPRCGDYRFDEEYFPNPKKMVERLHELGIETMVSIWPQVDTRSENYEEMKQQGLLVKINSGIDVQMLFDGNNVFMDATNPRTREYVWRKIKKNYADLGINAFWLDEAEPEFATYDFDNYRYYAGPVAEKGNIYPREYARLFYEGQKANGQQEIVNLIRCAWVGSQRYGALVWSGDIFSSYEDLRKQICAGLHMGLAGIPWWTTDIGGFHGGVTEDEGFRELLIRWFQFGTFCPVMRIHGSRLPFTPIVNKTGEVREKTGADNEIWSFGEEAYPVLRKFIGIRERMRDYTRELMRQAHEKGSPVMRTLFYEFPEDSACWDITDSYMFGPDILVAPVVYEGARSRKVYLPKGVEWVQAGSGKRYEGGKSYEIDAPIETLPVFLRDGRQGYLVEML